MLFRSSGVLGWLLWGLAHLAFMPANENRISLLVKWLWAVATRERASLLITGRPDQHIGVEVGLEPVELGPAKEAPARPLEPGEPSTTTPAPPARPTPGDARSDGRPPAGHWRWR